MADKIRWGILSTATINDVIIYAINRSSRSELIAVASRDKAKAQAYASKRSIQKPYGSYQDLLDNPEIDAVYISLPNTLHCEWTMRAAEARKHVLCEKPIVTTEEEFGKVDAARLKYNVIVFEAFMYLHHPQTLKVQELVQSGRLGEIQYIDSWFDYFLPEYEKDNIRVKRETAGGSLWDVGVYPNSMSITMAMAGAPVEAHAYKKFEEGIEVDTAVYGTLRFTNNIVAQISASIRSPFRVGTYITGREGYIMIQKPWKPGLDGNKSQIVLMSKDDKRETFTFPPVTPYQSEVAAMESCIIDGAKPLVPLSLSRDFLSSAIALHRSADTGSIVKLKGS
jgi:predicted dehydrogenase